MRRRVLVRLIVAFALLAVALLPGSALRPPLLESAPPESVPVLELPKERRARLAIRVTSEEQPVAGARAKAFFASDDGSALVGEVTTDAEGRALFSALPRGAHWIVVDADGRARSGTSLSIDEDDPPREIAVSLAREHVLEVRVRDEAGAPVAGAEVEVMGASPVPVGALTDAQGSAKVSRLGSGPFAVTARAPAQDLEEVSRTGVAEGAPYEIVLRKLGALVVRVQNPDGSRATGARVEIAGGSLGARSGETNGEALVRIASLPTGSYALRASKGAFVSTTELDVRLRGGEERAVTLRLEPGVFVDVHVLGDDAAGESQLAGVAGANVVLAEEGISPFPLEAVSDRQGRARLGPITRGPAAVSVSATGFVSRGGVGVPLPGSGSELRVVLPRAGVLEGRVVDSRGFPIGGATLVVIGTDRNGGPIDEDPRRARVRDSLFAASLPGAAPLLPRGELGVVPGPVPRIPKAMPTPTPAARMSALSPLPNDAPPSEPWTTRGDGTFRLSPVPPGRVRVLVRHPQYVEASSELVALDPAGRAEVTVVLTEGGVLEGVVVDDRGRPQVGVRVTALATRGLLERGSRTGDDGRFAFASLPPSVTLLVEGDDGRSTRLSVALEDGARREVRVVLPAPREPIDVRVRDDRDYPLDAVQLSVGSLDPATPLRTTAFTNARGEARIVGVRGLPLRITASHPGHAAKSISVEGASTTTVLALVLDRGESVVGEVRGRHVGALEGADVVVASESGTSRTTTTSRGAFRLEGLPPGRLRIAVRAKGHAPAERTVTIVPRVSGDRGLDLGRIDLAEESAVEGEVVDEAGKPVAGARIGRDHVPTWVPIGALPAGLAQTDARGVFRLGELPEGVITLEGFAADIGRGRTEGVRVSPGRPTSGIRIVLVREGARTAEANASGNVAVTLGTTDEGVTLTNVVAGSAADRAGLAEGDRVMSIDGVAVRTMVEARARFAGPVQDDVVVAVQRGDRALTVRVPREAVRR